MEEYEPKIIVFACKSCLPKNVGLEEIPLVREGCVNHLNPKLLLSELKKGADGILMLCSPPGECHSAEEDGEAFKRFVLLQRLLSDLRISRERLRFECLKESESFGFMKLVKEMTSKLKSLGPLRWENEA
ncbi:MAG: hydrogenase iron-sulfur subunit [Candidatus Altiarchaeota archaeon]|nr:hydrogenase iron-sulfur subunit [Candidatus Altiarchaeota archaeon]